MRVDETGQEIMTLDGLRWQYYDDDDTGHEVRYEDMNNKKKFEAAVKKKGLWAWFAYTHNIGQYFYDYKQRARFLGSESAYEEDTFFYITNVPGFEGKTIAFQLRVSNHRTVFSQWLTTHSKGIVTYNGKRGFLREKLMADFCLNLIMNPCGRPEDGKRNPSENDEIKIFCIDCYFKYYDYPEDSEERNKIDKIIKAIVDGDQPTIDYSTLQTLFGPCKVRSSIGGAADKEYREHNFGHRDNQRLTRNFFDYVVNKTDAKLESFPFSYIINNDISDGQEFVYKDGKKYKFDYDNNCVYFVNSRGRCNEKDPIPINVDENRRVVKLSINEIRNIVYRTLRKLL